MTHFLQRSALALLATTALCSAAAPASASGLTPRYPIRLSPAEAAAAAPPVARPAVLRDDDGPTALILAAHRRHHATHKAAEPAGPPAIYVVRKGDTLEKIAKTLGASIDELKDANGLKKSAIQPGQTLKNPKAAESLKATSRAGRTKGGKARPEPEAPPEPTTYTVKRGETLFAIAQKTHSSVDALRKANGLSARAQIKAGATLKLPGSAAAAEADQAPAPTRRGARSRAAESAAAEGRPGRVVDVEGPGASYRVRSGDNLSKVAHKLNTTVEQLKADNRLKGGMIHAGQTLRGPHATSKAYVAVSGDTVDDVARRFGVTARALRAKNGFGRRTASLKAGQKIRLPEGYRDHGGVRTPPSYPPQREDYTPVPTHPNAPSRGVELPSHPQPYVPSGDAPIATRRTTPYTPPGNGPAAVPIPSAALTDAQVAEMGKGRFIWPLQGQILSAFGPKSGGQKNDGVNIQADSGAMVRAAADGTVVYAGDQVPGFGNLVLLQHSEGWVTAYGHLSHIDVKNRQHISQGQQVGLAGATGGVPEPQLHFEVRLAPAPKDRALPIDPKLVLPK